MLGQDDPTRRFDYLFEPLDGDTDDAFEDELVVDEPEDGLAEQSGSGLTGRIAITAIVLASVAATVAIVLLLLRSGPADPAETRTGPATTAQTTPPSSAVLPTPASAATSEPPPPVTTAVIEPPGEPEVTQRPPSPSPSSPRIGPGQPELTVVAPTPTVRPPMSATPGTVSAPRGPDPGSHNNNHGGLLGGGGLL